MFKMPFTLFPFLLLIIPASAVDTDKWDLVIHQEIVPQQSFHVGDCIITLADREKNGLDDYTVIVYIEHNGNKQTELMRDGDTAFFDDDHSQLEYVGMRDDKQIFNAYCEKSYPYGGVVDISKNITKPVTSESVNTSTQPVMPTISFDNSNLIAVGILILLVFFKKH
jgi:hypothetical protein